MKLLRGEMITVGRLSLLAPGCLMLVHLCCRWFGLRDKDNGGAACGTVLLKMLFIPQVSGEEYADVCGCG